MLGSKIINGKKCAEDIINSIKYKTEEIKKKYNIVPGLAVILVGNNPASRIYVSNKKNKTIFTGMNSYEFEFQEKITQKELLTKIEELNKDSKVNGILVQLPLPDHIDENAVINHISPEKDVDGFHTINTGKLSIGQDCLVPCTPQGCIILLKTVIQDLRGLDAVIAGRSNIVGKPMCQLLLKENCTVTIAHSSTKNFEEKCRNADILISAVGKQNLIRGSHIKEGAIVIDVGINYIKTKDGKNKLTGDVNFPEAEKKAKAITPVPGGVGPMTIACLLKNTLKATCIQNNIYSKENQI